jgi:OmcA/MtrC family decaheme c-type cytochrome
MKARVPLAAALTLAALALGPGCKGDPGPAGPAGDAGPAGNPAVTLITVPSNSETPTDAASAAWAALAPNVTVQSVTISSPPIVKFTVTDAAGIPIAGLGNTSQSSTQTVPGLTNLAFAMAKLVPGVNNGPSRWVSYMVTTVPSTTAASAPTRPSTDNTGTLADNGDGTYVYTFYRDVPRINDTVAAMTVSAPNNKDDLGDLRYDSSLVHRLTIQLAGNAPGTGSNTPTAVTNVPGVPLQKPVDAIYDFKPGAAGAAGTPVTASGRDMVTTTNCNTCHQVLGGIPGDNPEASGAGFHGGSRNEVRYCVVCHTEQRKYGRTEATRDATLTFTSQTYRFYDRAIGNLPNEIHKIHGGGVLAYKKYNYADVEFNEVEYPQDIRNCNKCHDATNATTPDAKNWMERPSRLACGACHDGMDFATGQGVTLADAAKGLTVSPQGHLGGIQPDDARCADCHADPTRPDININSVHVPVTPPNPGNALVLGGTNANTNAAWILSNPARKPAGAIVVTYDIKSVKLDGSRHPQMVFRMLQDGVPKNLNDPTNSTPNPATGQRELWDNFMGGPSLYFVFAVPQDGFTTPADFNATVSGYLRTIWNGSASAVGNLSPPDGDGYYTGTLTGVTIPTSAVMLTGGMGYSYNVTSTLPLTQTNVGTPGCTSGQRGCYPVTAPTANPAPACASSTTNVCKQGGLIVIAPNVNKVATNFTGRRAIVEDARCNKCHQELGTFTEDAFHAGQRNDGTTCSWCHTPNRASSGWSADSVYFVHAIHAGAKRTTDFTWHAATATSSFEEVKYPGVLNFCEGCHVPGAVNFSNQASEDALPNRLYRTVATGALNGNFSNGVGQTILVPGTAPSCILSASAPATELGKHQLSPYAASAVPGTKDPNYGIAFSFNAGLSATNPACTPDGAAYSIGAGQSVEDVPAANTAYDKNLVLSPITSVCFACHDTSAAMAHFDLNGGSIYKTRSEALNTVETCIICHGSGRIADIKEVHSH